MDREDHQLSESARDPDSPAVYDGAPTKTVPAKPTLRVQYLWVFAVGVVTSLFALGVGKHLEHHPGNAQYDKSTRVYVWAAICGVASLYTLCRAWRSPKGKL